MTDDEWFSHLSEPFKSALKVLAMIPPEGDEGVFKCPICADGEIHWSRVGRKRHLWMACTTEKCVRARQ